MRWLISFPLRYASVILVATVVAANHQPLPTVLAVGGVAILVFPFISPDRLKQTPTVYRAEVLTESPWVALAMALGSGLGRVFFPS